MEDPVTEIIPIIHSLTTDPPSKQRHTLETYFTPTASFTHPFCRTGSFDGSRWVIRQIYRWYKIISPRIEIVVDSVAFDEKNLRLYVGIRQNFRLWMVPRHCADVGLTTVLDLTQDPYPHVHESDLTKRATVLGRGNSKDISSKAEMQGRRIQEHSSRLILTNGSTRQRGGKYWIQSQNDLYQTSEWIKFLVPWGIGWRLVVAWHFFATFLCVVGALALFPFTVLLERVLGGNAQRARNRNVLGKD